MLRIPVRHFTVDNLRAVLPSVLTETSRTDFLKRVRQDNHSGLTELNIRQGEANPTIDNRTFSKKLGDQFGDGEGSRSPYFRRKLGDSSVLVAVARIPANPTPANEAEAISQPWFLLTQRSYQLRSHRGEICFPGGKIEKEERIEHAALREAKEEIALPLEAVTVWSTLRPSLTRNLKNNVNPVFGVFNEDVLNQLHPTDDEVQNIFLVPMSDFIKTRSYTSFVMPKFKYTLPLYFSENFKVVSSTKNAYLCSDRRIRIWGLSAVIAHQTLTCLLPPAIYARGLRYF